MAPLPQYIDISDDEDILEVSDSEDTEDLRLAFGRHLEEDVYDSDDEALDFAIYQSLKEARAAKGSSTQETQKKSQLTPARNGRIRPPFLEDVFAKVGNGLVIRVGETVELERGPNLPTEGTQSGDFLRVQHIIRNLENDEVALRGLKFRRAKYMGRTYDKKLNEVVLLLNVDHDDDRPPFEQAMEDVELTSVVRKRDLVITNARYPNLSFRQAPVTFKSAIKRDRIRQVHDFERLVCRQVEVISWDTAALRQDAVRKSYAGEIRLVYPHEADQVFDDEPPTFNVEGSKENPFSVDEVKVDDPTTPSPPESTRKRQLSVEVIKCRAKHKKPRAAFRQKVHKYKFADCFHGAGGASRGAAMAGLEIYCGFDHDELAWLAYCQNFPSAESFRMDAADFPPKNFGRIDVMHFSPPCQVWSPAHTNAGKNDEANMDTLFTIGALLKSCNPRIATLEQTAGLVTHHRGYLQIVFNQFVGVGYSVRWRIEHLQEFGIPQRRKRLILVAARRGEPLPPLPKRSHGPEGTGLKPFATIRDALAPLRLNPPADDIYHRPNEKKRYDVNTYDADDILKSCITTKGGEHASHYSGKRKYTAREMACLQTFPLHHKFTGQETNAIKQVGNAVPPLYMRLLCTNVVKTLAAFDAGNIRAGYTLVMSGGDDARILELASYSRSPSTARGGPIKLDDSDDDAAGPSSFPPSPSIGRGYHRPSITNLPPSSLEYRFAGRPIASPRNSIFQRSQEPPTPPSSQSSGRASFSSSSPLKNVEHVDLTEDPPSPSPSGSQTSKRADQMSLGRLNKRIERIDLTDS